MRMQGTKMLREVPIAAQNMHTCFLGAAQFMLKMSWLTQGAIHVIHGELWISLLSSAGFFCRLLGAPSRQKPISNNESKRKQAGDLIDLSRFISLLPELLDAQLATPEITPVREIILSTNICTVHLPSLTKAIGTANSADLQQGFAMQELQDGHGCKSCI